MYEQDHFDEEEEEGGAAPGPTGTKRLLNFRAAMGLYAVLAVVSLLTLQGKFIIFMLVVLGGIAVLTHTHHLREKLDD